MGEGLLLGGAGFGQGGVLVAEGLELRLEGLLSLEDLG